MKNRMHNTNFVRSLIGERIQQARGKMSREAFCRIISECSFAPNGKSLEPDTLRQWERGINPVHIDWIPAICDVLDCEVGYLFGEFPDKRRDATTLREITELSDSAIHVLSAKKETPIGRIARLESLGVKPSQEDIEAAEEYESLAESAAFQDFYDERFHIYKKTLEDPLSPAEKRELRMQIEEELRYIHSPEGYFDGFRYSRSSLDALMGATDFNQFLRQLDLCRPAEIDDSLFLSPYDFDTVTLVGSENEQDRRRLSVQLYAGKIAEEIMKGGQDNAISTKENK